MSIVRYPRPILAMRVGITGARDIEPAHIGRVERQIGEVLALVRDEMAAFAANSVVGRAYVKADGKAVLRFLSPLAVGSDQIAAKAAFDLGYHLYIPMPFEPDEYACDFASEADRTTLRELLRAAGEDRFVLDGARGDLESRSYEAVGRLVARLSDILIAVWDGKPGKGPGGTSDTLHFAAATGTPVVWIHASEDVVPRFIAESLDLTHPKPVALDWASSLRDHLDRLVMPPSHLRRHHHDFVGRLADLFKRDLFSPHEDHFAEVERPSRWPWRAYSALIRRMAGDSSTFPPLRCPVEEPARHWHDRYVLPDGRSSEYAARYRSSYVWVFLFATLSLVAGATALVVSLLGPAHYLSDPLAHAIATVFATAEFAFLSLILALVAYVRRHDWHERSIEYRLLAELCRKQQVLAPIGWELPFTAVEDLIGEEDGAPLDRAAWVAWLFAAERRAAPFPHGALTPTSKDVARQAVLDDLILSQIDYHVMRHRVSEAAGQRLEQLGIYIFFAIMVAVVAKLVFSHWIELPPIAILSGWLATVLPGVSAAFVGIRSYTELQLLAEQSKHMLSALHRARTHIERLDMARPLASQELGAEAAATAALMLQDLEGWARLFRLKGAEVG
ncbi:MAG: hypothetical protein GX458_07530 [Phyllobacteriaceae bacterium]|nr:hypothetical protein [Phyllobacteriaceae bacterium]